jgi:hypothetical protein
MKYFLGFVGVVFLWFVTYLDIQNRMEPGQIADTLRPKSRCFVLQESPRTFTRLFVREMLVSATHFDAHPECREELDRFDADTDDFKLWFDQLPSLR